MKFTRWSVNDAVITCDGKTTRWEVIRNYHSHLHLKMKYETERENNIKTYFLDLLNNRRKNDLTIGINQQTNKADLIIHSIPVIERNTHKKQHDKWQPAGTTISERNKKQQLYLEYRTKNGKYCSSRLDDREVGITFGTKVEIPGRKRLWQETTTTIAITIKTFPTKFRTYTNTSTNRTHSNLWTCLFAFGYRWDSNTQDLTESVHVNHNVTKCTLGYEPFYVARVGTPDFDERFIGYGWSRNTQVH